MGAGADPAAPGAALGGSGQLPLYRSPGWTIMRDDYLSTSSAPSVNIQYFGFGSTSSRCIGIAYVLLPDRFHVYRSTPLAVADGMHAFAARLREAVHELRELLAEGPRSTATRGKPGSRALKPS
ncbi:choline/carnitine O-acyltransferase [Streptomyces sp. 7N604]|uniref:choline/carnitine O-acyltransferase n=1 Tax=Streptomyces sp. 7N604 TaxID=3457415 RepID=UPI003FD36554